MTSALISQLSAKRWQTWPVSIWYRFFDDIYCNEGDARSDKIGRSNCVRILHYRLMDAAESHVKKTYETEIDGSDPTAEATFSYKAFADRLDGISWCWSFSD